MYKLTGVTKDYPKGRAVSGGQLTRVVDQRDRGGRRDASRVSPTSGIRHCCKAPDR